MDKMEDRKRERGWVGEISLKSCRKTGRHETRIFAPPLVRGWYAGIGYTRVPRETTRRETKSSIHDVRHKYLHVSL